MTDIAWVQVADGYDGGIYRIRRAQGPATGGWRLEVVGKSREAGNGWVVTSTHTATREALAAAGELEAARRRRARVSGNVAAGVVACAAFAAVSGSVSSIGSFVIAMLAIFVALRSFAAAVGVLLADAWGWSRDPGDPHRLGILEQLALRVADWRSALIVRRGIDPPQAVWVLPPSGLPPGRSSPR